LPSSSPTSTLYYIVIADPPNHFSTSSLYASTTPRPLHSFPTRRSSDLSGRSAARSGSPSSPICYRATRCRPRPPSPATSPPATQDRKSTRLNCSHVSISYAVFCLKKKKTNTPQTAPAPGHPPAPPPQSP